MAPAPRKHRLNFRTEVVVPVVIVMVLLLILVMWVVHWQVTAQMRADATRQLDRAQTVFAQLRNTHASELSWRYRNLVNEPRVKALAGLDDPGQATFHKMLEDWLTENVADVITLTPASGKPFTVARDPQLDTRAFETNSAMSVRQAVVDETGNVGVAQVGAGLYDTVSLPIHGVGDAPEGAITFGVVNTWPDDFDKLTGNRLVLIASGGALPTSFLKPDLQRELMSEISTPNPDKPGDNRIILGGEHFLYLAGKLDADSAGSPGYLILTSYESSWQALQRMQVIILLASLAAIVAAVVVVWAVVRRITRPLEELRDTAEAVGRGDFSRRVVVRSNDECGELAEVFNQMTENLKVTQAQLIQSEKLSAIGEFVAGVAHELNNPLTTVMGVSELLKEDASLDVKHAEFVDLLFKSAQRCQRIVQSLLSFARKHLSERKPANIKELLESVLDILGYQLRTSNIKVKLQLGVNLPPVMADAHLLQQVFVNVINNARQAVEAERPEGWIQITTEPAGDFVRIIIQDSGPGISPQNLAKIFDPFFTTKEVGKGTGLGLSLCYGIIKEHGGNITPSSQPGEGATFTIELPATRVVQAAAEAPAPRAGDADGAGKKILVIDDEEPILQVIREALVRHGYEVETTSDGHVGLQRLRQNHYDVILCDWKMPGLNGQQFYEKLRNFNPALSDCLIFISGDIVSEKTRRFFESEKKICLSKPFALSEFRAAVGRASQRS